MDRILAEELQEYVRHGREERNLEFKSAINWADKNHQTKVVKSVIAMSNIPDGGVIVIGVQDDGTPTGIPQREVTALSHDNIAPIVNEYAAPYVEISVVCGHLPEDEDRWFVVIQVKEADQIPVICRKPGLGLAPGAVYTRSRRQHETRAIQSEAEMRELFNRALDRAIRSHIGRMQSVGLVTTPQTDDVSLFDTQLGGL